MGIQIVVKKRKNSNNSGLLDDGIILMPKDLKGMEKRESQYLKIY